MFKSLKLYTGASLDLEAALSSLVEFEYTRQEKVSEEGDFSRRGGILDIFPFTFELPIRIELDADAISSIRTFDPATGKPLWEHQMVIVLPMKKISSFKSGAFNEDFPLENFLDLKIGDYVVHNQHGIGIFRGMEKIKIGDEYKDHLIIEYERQEKLYVPVDQMNLVQKYAGLRTRKPKLYRLGSNEWSKVKNRVSKGVQVLSLDLLSLEAMRRSISGFAFSPDNDWQREFEATFPYRETPDQVRATQEVKADMLSSKPMDRLLCGDVGYGKTEVAMRAVFKAALDNKQVAFLVPTTILAEQHYQNFLKRLQDFPVNVAMLSRFKTQHEQKEIIKAIALGSVDIVIGTHRLLSTDIKFKDLGLVIIDEEQRFGVKAKEKLKGLRLTCDVLTLTATPIPRTLYMSLMAAKDLSLINTPPQNRLPVKTIVVEYDQDIIRQAIAREVSRKGQVYLVHNRVEDIERFKEKISRIIPSGTRLAIAHGQMHPHTLEKVMLDFFSAKIDILLCTMIIESGLDVPNVNTIIVDNAQAFGLSDLHQLRGRVGRFDRPAYAYFLIPSHGVLDTDARKRLNAIQEHAHLGAGFKIAMEDLEIRGAGNLLGEEQHGFISAVGFDLYCRMLREAVSNLKKVMTNEKS